MKSLLKNSVIALLCSFSLAQATCDDEAPRTQENSHFYMSAGYGPHFFIPTVGVGYRQRLTNSFGWDSALNYSTTGREHQLGAHVLGHYYLNADQKNSAYLGAGARTSVTKQNGDKSLEKCVAVNFVVGKTLMFEDSEASHFIEMHVCTPSFWSEKHLSGRRAAALVYVAYGMGF